MQTVYNFIYYIQEMQKGQNCIGCKTSFQQGSTLPLQDLVIELKNYDFPIRDQKHKWILLKTIVSLLNSKGGIIFVGAEDKTGQVIGLQISRKQQDQFKLFIQKLVERIQPSVDLSNREDVIMQFVPVTRGGANTGRYLGKIIVKQGDTAKLYCFSQKVVLQSITDKKYDQFDVVYSYKRINMGSVKELQGYEAVTQAAYRALNPPKVVNIFHEGCNPQPLSASYAEIPQSQKQARSSPTPKQSPRQAPLRVPSPPPIQALQKDTNYAIQFFRIKDAQVRQKLSKKLQQYVGQTNAKQYNISYEQQTDTLLLEFQEKKDWQKVLDLVDGKLQDLNQALEGDAVFSKKQAENDFAVYQNQKPSLMKCLSREVCQLKEEQYDTKKEQSRPKSGSKKYVQKSPQQTQKVQKSQTTSQLDQVPILQNKSQSIEQQIQKKQQQQNQQYQIKLTSQNKNKKSVFTKGKFVSLPNDINIDGVFALTITHLNIQKKSQLIKYIESLTNSKKKVDQFERTIQFHFQKQQDFNEVYDKLSKSKDLTKYGFNKTLIFGVNTGQITFDNYDRKKYKEFKEYITKFVGDEMKRCEFTKKGTKYSLVLTLKSVDRASMWLDKFINDKAIKEFRIPNNDALKMKIDLVCVKPNTNKNAEEEAQ